METGVAAGVYRHYKGGLYRVLLTAWDSERKDQGNRSVIYVSLATGEVWHRPMADPMAASWLDMLRIENDDGSTRWVDRFTYVGIQLSPSKEVPADGNA